MGYLEGFGVTIRQHRLFGGKRLTKNYSGGRAAKKALKGRAPRRAGRRPRRRPTPRDDVKIGQAGPRCTAATSSTATRTGWRSASAASCAPASARRTASTCAAPTTTRRTRRRRASASGSSTRSTTCAASTATCASRPARPRRSPSRSCSSSRSPTGVTPSTPKAELLVGDDGQPKRLPWEDWREGEDADTSGWVRATAPSGDADFVGAGRLERRARLRHPRSGGPGAVSRRAADLARFVASPPSGRDPCSESVTIRARIAAVRESDGVMRSDRVRRRLGDGARRRHRRGRCTATRCTAALSLVLTLFGVAVHFVAMEAHFLAAVQVIVYAGAIVVLFLFVIMLLGVDQRRGPARRAAPDPAPAGRGDGRRHRRPARSPPSSPTRDTAAAVGRLRVWRSPARTAADGSVAEPRRQHPPARRQPLQRQRLRLRADVRAADRRRRRHGRADPPRARAGRRGRAA